MVESKSLGILQTAFPQLYALLSLTKKLQLAMISPHPSALK